MKNLCLFLCLVMHSLYAVQDVTFQTEVSFSSEESELQDAFHYFLDEVELDATLTHEAQQDKIQEFKIFAENLSPQVAFCLTDLLIEETRSRIFDMLQNAAFDPLEIDRCLDGYDEAIFKVQSMNVEIAREMLFFVAELKIHREYVHDFGVALGCPEKQLLRHDLCKLDTEQFEGYARYFRGGRKEEDKLRYLAAWELHQYEEHHHQSYSKEGFSFDSFSEERLRNNMLETVADLLAASKQRGGSTLIHYLVHIFPKQNSHQRLLPFLEDALRKAHAFYLDSEGNPDSGFKLFQGLPCWNHDVEEVFSKLKEAKLCSFSFSSENAFSIPQEKIADSYSYPVGELGALWQFPSDHLPVGGTIGALHFVVWNILDTKYLQHIVDNGQGLRDSLILQTNVPCDQSKLTVREALIVKDILAMVHHPTHPRALIALEEMSKRVYVELGNALPEHMCCIPDPLDEIWHGDVFIYDTQVFEYVSFQSKKYKTNRRNDYSTLTLIEKRTGLTYRFIQSHVPGGPVHSVPARQELANSIMQEFDPRAISVVMGDMNQSPEYFIRDFAIAAQKYGLAKQPFEPMPIPYPTHINTLREASWIDNVFISNPYAEIPCDVIRDGSEIFESMQTTIDLLESFNP